jgi:hypothetical protein
MKKKRALTNRATVVPRAVQRNRFEVVDSAVVDGEKWFVVHVEPRVTPWIREQENNLWYEHTTSQYRYRVLDTFDVHERLYTLMSLRWS